MFYVRIFISLIYELIILIAIAFIVSFAYLFCLHDVDFDEKITLHQFIIWLTWVVILFLVGEHWAKQPLCGLGN